MQIFMPASVHGGSASGDDYGRMFPDKLRVNSFLDRFPHCAWTTAQSAKSDFVGSRVYACLGVTCHLHFWRNDRGLLRATTGTREWERTPNKSQHIKLTLEKKILPPILLGFELATFRSRGRRSYQQAIQAPHAFDRTQQNIAMSFTFCNPSCGFSSSKLWQ